MKVAHRAPPHAQGCYKRHCILQSTQQRHRSTCRSALYNRNFELQNLGSLLDEQPNGITVVLGPRGCGKTAILQSFLADKPNAVYLDCRLLDVSTPAVFANEVLQLLLPKVPKKFWDEVLERLQNLPPESAFILSSVKLTVKGLQALGQLDRNGDIRKDMSISIPDPSEFQRTASQKEGQSQSLAVVYKMISDLLIAWELALPPGDGCKWPVLVIDEANVLQEWKGGDRSIQLAGLLRFLVQISRQSRRCHVLMATSEHAFQAWLSNAIGPRFWEPVVIGNFTADHAREFLESELQRARERRQKQSNNSATWAKLDDAAWVKVYEVCGGNAGNLVRLASKIDQPTSNGDWDTALEQLWRVEMRRVKRLALGISGAWTPEQYAEVAIQLLDSKHHALPDADVEMMLGCHVVTTADEDQQQKAGAPVLHKLVEANALSVRPLSNWAQDIPFKSFGDEEAVVTAPSTMDLYCMSRLRKLLETRLDKWKRAKNSS